MGLGEGAQGHGTLLDQGLGMSQAGLQGQGARKVVVAFNDALVVGLELRVVQRGAVLGFVVSAGGNGVHGGAGQQVVGVGEGAGEFLQAAMVLEAGRGGGGWSRCPGCAGRARRGGS